jgi:ubiquinone/menaquinone biosynthesis C-methylase UbiE
VQQTSADTEHGVLSGSEWLETHFEACRDEYIEMLRSIGIERGWHVLDAGCGAGSFLPELVDLVGPLGAVEALDPDEAHIAGIQRRYANTEHGCPVTASVGALSNLPFESGRFDAVWCANVLQYFDDDELKRALSELGRVVHRSGLVGVKDVDMLLARIGPGDPCLMTRLADACATGEHALTQSRGSLRGRELRRWLERASFLNVRQHTVLIERWAPLRPVEQRLWNDWLGHLAEVAACQDLPLADRETWRKLHDPDRRLAFIEDPDFYACEGQVVVVAEVP